MGVRLISRLKPHLSLAVILSAFFKRRKNSVKKFETEFAKKFDCSYGVMFSYGRTGLYSLFKSWELNNDEVICPAYTCVVVPHAVVLSGNIPVFVDSSEDSFNMDIKKLEEAITKKTKAVVVTHLFGYPMDVVSIQKLIKRKELEFGHKIYIIQDVAHSFGAKWNNQLVTSFGDAAVFGLNISKILTTVFGGIVITNSENTYNKLINYRATEFKSKSIKSFKRLIYSIVTYIVFKPIIYGIVNWLERKSFLDNFVKYYDESVIDFPSDWDILPCSFEAEVGRYQLKLYDDIIKKRIDNALLWQKKYKKNEEISFLKNIDGTTYSHCVALVQNRNIWIETYKRKGIQLGILIEYCIPQMKAYERYSKNQDFPNAKYFSEHTINFPNYPNLYLIF